MMDRKRILATVGVVWLLCAAGPGATALAQEEPGMSTNIVKGLFRNRVCTTPDAGNPDLRTRLYAGGPKKIFDYARTLAGKRRGWKIVDANLDDGVLKIEARTRIFRFVDDVIIRVRSGAGRRIAPRHGEPVARRQGRLRDERAARVELPQEHR